MPTIMIRINKKIERSEKMKYLIVSDIHGSSYYANKINEIYIKEHPDKIILLGTYIIMVQKIHCLKNTIP